MITRSIRGNRHFEEVDGFTRGWTLQELLAPALLVEFFSKEGERLGNRQSLKRIIHEITGISLSALQGVSLSQFSVDERFEWAQSRETAREKDWAYSLIGMAKHSILLHITSAYGKVNIHRGYI